MKNKFIVRFVCFLDLTRGVAIRQLPQSYVEPRPLKADAEIPPVLIHSKSQNFVHQKVVYISYKNGEPL